ncbi:MAG: imidazoleglycerol-phosphate dehydratase [Deltaproteobacteria bacterium]|jgi:imidazoleglycerol-phosphate dehydratase|nr:imidazoleglycerol-phosphate dehydratase [Deltaproteobacteria bacterium]
MKTRSSSLSRSTRETNISLRLNLDGKGQIEASTGFGLADHLITLLCFWAGFDLKLNCAGDLDIDAHHTVEDSALCLGQAILEALGDRRGIARVGAARVPMDEALADVCLDLSGRSYLVFNGSELLPPVLAGEERELWREFFRALAAGARMNLHISFLYGKNGHHLLESAGKGAGLALRQAVQLNRGGLLSTKGRLD